MLHQCAVSPCYTPAVPDFRTTSRPPATILNGTNQPCDATTCVEAAGDDCMIKSETRRSSSRRVRAGGGARARAAFIRCARSGLGTAIAVAVAWPSYTCTHPLASLQCKHGAGQGREAVLGGLRVEGGEGVEGKGRRGYVRRARGV